MNYRYLKFLIVLIVVATLSSCAKRGRPTGGEKDETAPILISASPEQESTNFDAKKIKIYFDEYIKLKDINTQLIISPPLKNDPDIIPVGTASKTISIKLFDTLKENTTYTFNFGNSVEDNNEGNKLEKFKYVFSTGEYIDSLKLEGTVKDAFAKETDEDVLVMLYEITPEFNDSIVYKEKPTYVTSTLDSINFELTNLKGGEYLMLALKQPNNKYIYNPKQDKIGFLKEPITLPTDSTFKLEIFKEILPFKVIRGVETTKGHILFSFQGDPTDLKIKLLDETTSDFVSAIAFEKDKDSLGFWYRKLEKDSVLFEVANKDYIDTLTVKLKAKKQDTLILKNDIGSVLNFRDTMAIGSNIPLINLDSTKFSLVDKDTVKIPFKLKINNYKNKVYVQFEKKYKHQYNLEILPNAIEDVFGNTNDTLKYSIRTKTIEDYGIINLTISNVNSPVIIQLLSNKEELISSNKINTSQTIQFSNLKPGKYIARAIFDDNNNGKWDTGNFLTKQFPEKVLYFKTLLELRANWDLNEVFTLE